MKNPFMQLRAVHSIISFFEFKSQLVFSLLFFAILKKFSARVDGKTLKLKNSIHLSNEDKLQTKMASTGYFPETGK